MRNTPSVCQDAFGDGEGDMEINGDGLMETDGEGDSTGDTDGEGDNFGEITAEADGLTDADGVGLAPGVLFPQAASAIVRVSTTAKISIAFLLIFLPPA